MGLEFFILVLIVGDGFLWVWEGRAWGVWKGGVGEMVGDLGGALAR